LNIQRDGFTGSFEVLRSWSNASASWTLARAASSWLAARSADK
jgi:hypothetical protein